MKEMGLYDKFGEKLGWVEYDGVYYLNGHLFGMFMFDSLAPCEFWSWANDLGLQVGSF